MATAHTLTRTRRNAVMSVQDCIDSYLDHHRAKGSSEHTTLHYANTLAHLKAFCDDKKLTGIDMISSADLQRCFLIWQQETKPNTHRGRVGDVRAFFMYCEDMHLLAENPWHKRMMPKKSKITQPRLADEDIAFLFEATRGSDVLSIRNRAILAVFLDSGVRLEECAELNKSDINITTGEVLVIDGKGGKTRSTYLGAKALDAVRRWLSARKRNSSQVLWLGIKGVLTYSGLAQVINTISEDAQNLKRKATGDPDAILHTSPHQLRRTFAVLYLKAGGNIYQLQRMMGHESLDTLRKYQDIADRECHQAHQHFSPFDAIALAASKPKVEGLKIGKRKAR